MNNKLNINILNSKVILPFIIIAAIAGTVYLNALNNGFHYDDEHDIVTNTFLEKWENIPRFFTSTQFYKDKILSADHYRPLVYMSYALNKIAGGNNSFGYHLVNLAFHIGSAFLVFLILRAMLAGGAAYTSLRTEDKGRWGFVPLAAALIFAVHPFNSEVVNYITARSSVMSSFFYLLAFYSWVKFRMEGVGGRAPGVALAYYMGSLLAFLLGMLCKEMVITLPIVFCLYDYYFISPSRSSNSMRRTLFHWRTYLPYLPFVLMVVIPALVVRLIYWGGVVPSFKRSLMVQLYTELPVLVKHLWLFVFPVGLNVDHYSEIYRSFFAWPVAVSALILILYIILAVVAYRVRGMEWRVVSFFMVWFFIVLLPTIVIPLNAIFQENRGYLGVVMFSVLAAVVVEGIPRWAAGQGVQKRWVPTAMLAVLLVIYGGGTVYRNDVWSDGLSLWSDAAAKSPESSRAHINLGTEYTRLGKNQKALESFLKALRLPDSGNSEEQANIHYNLGTVYQQMGRDDMAMNEYSVAAEISPSDFRPHYNLGIIYQQRGELEAAAEAYKRVIERNVYHFKSFHNLGLLYHNRGDIANAEEYYKKALSLNPDYSRSRINLAALYDGKGDLTKAIELYREVVRRNPGDSRIQEHIRSLEERLIFSPLP